MSYIISGKSKPKLLRIDQDYIKIYGIPRQLSKLFHMKLTSFFFAGVMISFRTIPWRNKALQ